LAAYELDQTSPPIPAGHSGASVHPDHVLRVRFDGSVAKGIQVTALLNWRVWAAVALVVVFAISHGVAYRTGRDEVQADWDKDITERTVQALAAEQAARAKEQTLQTKNTKVSADYEKQKASNRALAISLDDSLRQLQAAIADTASPNSPPIAGTNGTGGLDRELLGNCARTLAELGQTADRLEGKVVGLQSYVAEVCKN